MDVFDLQQATSPQLSPDGRRVVFVLTRRDLSTDTRIQSLQLQDAAGAWHSIADSEGCGFARWAIESRRLALICKRGDRTTLEIVDTASSRRTTLVDSREPVLDLAWSNRGDLLAFVKFVPDAVAAPPFDRLPGWASPYRAPITRLIFEADGQGELPRGTYQMFIARADGDNVKQITSGTWWTGGVGNGPNLVWAPDGSEVYLSATRRPDWDVSLRDRNIFAVRIADGDVRQVTAAPWSQTDPALSPNGRWLAYTAEEDRGLSVQTRHAYVVPVNGGTARLLAPGFDRSIDQLAWRSDGRALFVSFEDAGDRVLATMTLEGRVSILAHDLGGQEIEYPLSSSRFSVSRNDTIAFVRSTSSVPSEVMIREPRGQARAATHLNSSLESRIGGFESAESFQVKASVDGRPLDAWLIRARDANASAPKPLILDIHGGPFGQYGDRFSVRYQLFAAAGFNIVYGNPRGSTGYGEQFGNLIHNDWPGHDGDDLLDIVSAARQRDFVDSHNVFISGTSGGGTMSLWCVAHSDIFRAAVVVKPLVDWTSWVLTSDLGPELFRQWTAGSLPWTDREAYWRRSPLSLARQIKTPIMLISGDNDLRAPAGQAHEMYSALKLAGVETAWVRGPAVTHSSWAYRPSLFLEDVAYSREWFEQHLDSHGRVQ
jgi:dipeptidyl aminopeptidase/acylaminoacyl peptidase